MSQVIKPVSRDRVLSMLRYFRNKKVAMKYTYWTSIHGTREHTFSGVYDDFIMDYFYGLYGISFRKDGKEVFHQEIHESGMFVGMGHIKWHEGLVCEFMVTRKKAWWRRLLCL